VAVATLNGHIVFFDGRTNVQTGSIEGRNDLYVGKSDTDLITAKKSKEGKGYFSTLAYTSDGSCILVTFLLITFFYTVSNFFFKGWRSIKGHLYLSC